MPDQARSPPAEPERYGRYELVEQIGKGGMAEVFRAVTHEFEGFRRAFVIKRIRPEKSDSAEFIEMFCDEARISALLNHPNIVQVYDFGQINGSYFMAMEYLRGKDLASVLRALRAAHAAVDPSIAAYVAQQVALGLHHAHTANLMGGAPGQIVHRDVTPSNIMLLRTGGVKILDFGIAKATAVARQADTQNGRVKGKLAYLSPEQVRASGLDARSDVFALGVVLWEMLAGARLFPGENEFQTMRNVLMAPVPAPSSKRAEVPTALDAIVQKALERDPDQRYASAQAMADDLERVLTDLPCSSQALPRLLQSLFGEDATDPAADSIALTPADLMPVGPSGPVAAPPAEAAAAPAPAPAEVSSSWTQPGARAGIRARGRRLIMVVAALTLIGCLGWAARARYRQVAMVVEGPAPNFRPPAPVPVPVPAPAPAPAPAGGPAPARPAAAEPVQILLTVESVPAGADVFDEGGAALGTTPLSLALARSPAGMILKLQKAGYAPVAHTVVLDRAQTIRAALEPVLAHGPRPRRGPAPDVTKGLTIDPFR